MFHKPFAMMNYQKIEEIVNFIEPAYSLFDVFDKKIKHK